MRSSSPFILHALRFKTEIALLLLDYLADLECTGERFDRALRQMAGSPPPPAPLGSSGFLPFFGSGSKGVGRKRMEGIFWVLREIWGLGFVRACADVSGSSSFWMDGEDCKCAFSKPPARGLCFRITVRFNDSMRGSQGFCQGFVRVLVRRRVSVLLCSSSIVEPCMITYAVSGTPEVPAGAATCLDSRGPCAVFAGIAT